MFNYIHAVPVELDVMCPRSHHLIVVPPTLDGLRRRRLRLPPRVGFGVCVLGRPRLAGFEPFIMIAVEVFNAGGGLRWEKEKVFSYTIVIYELLTPISP